MSLPRTALSRLVPLLVVAAVTLLVYWTCRSPVSEGAKAEAGSSPADLRVTVERLNAEFQRQWSFEHLTPAPPASNLQVFRRLSLALHGSVPSLEEIRRFESDAQTLSGDELLQLWTRRLLADERFHAYFAERFARAFVGTEGTPFILFRRDRFVQWLREQLRQGTPYDAVVREIISQTGIWTDRPATNFLTSGLVENELDENKLAGRTVRAFLGQRIDCAQCHDHPFEEWKQSHFQGLAAFYGQTKLSIVGMEDRSLDKGEPVVYRVEDRKTLEKRIVDEAVPFHPEWLPAEGSRRARLATWITHRENRRFERATANRVWALLFGRAWHEPVDDLRNPPDGQSDILDILGRDFREHGCDLRRLIQIIALSEPFRLDSALPVSSDGTSSEKLTTAWAAFPLIRLRPEQVIGSILQSSTVQTTDQNSHLFFRFIRFVQGEEFLKEYGDLGADELLARGGTIPQRLLLMNGKLASEAMEVGPITAAGRISGMSSSPEHVVETAYLVCLTRRPTPEEKAHFVNQLTIAPKVEHGKVVEDLCWSLVNSTEFAWNH